jgi:hypothetical protein
MNLDEIFQKAAAVSVGGVLYLGLNWIPIIGPLVAGLSAGKIAGGRTNEGFKIGIYSGILGTILVIILLNRVGIFNTQGINSIVVFLVAWILLLWNLTGILFAGIGGALGNLVQKTSNIIEQLDMLRRPVRPHPIRLEPPKEYKREYSHEYVICPKCGVGNPAGADTCSECKNQLKG